MSEFAAIAQKPFSARPVEGVVLFPPGDVRRGDSMGALSAADFCTIRECRQLLQPRLSGALWKLFRHLTGLPLHIRWQETDGLPQAEPKPGLCPIAAHRCQNSSRLSPTCQKCLLERWQPALHSGNEGRRFTGACGSANFCIAATAAGRPLVALLLQSPGGTHSPNRTRPEHRSGWPGTLSVAEFQRAIQLARLICHDLQATLAARPAEQAKLQANRPQSVLSATDFALCPTASAPCAALATAPTGVFPSAHTQQLVQHMLDYLGTHYQRPLQLNDLAAALRMTPCYLCTLFSHTLGVTFHHYLDELRLAKAKELLGDPARKICEVACAVGYASAGHFGRAFKAHTGLTPCQWRQRA